LIDFAAERHQSARTVFHAANPNTTTQQTPTSR
jgi:hypothetical protein